MIGSLDFSNINIGAIDIGLGNFALPTNITLFNAQETEALNNQFKRVATNPRAAAESAAAISTNIELETLDFLRGGGAAAIRQEQAQRQIRELQERLSTTRPPAIPIEKPNDPLIRIRPKSLPVLKSSDPKQIPYRKERYTWRKRDYWENTAPGSNSPARFTYGEQPANMLAVLDVDGIVVKIDFADEGGVRFDDWYLVSPATLKELQDEANPHYDISKNGELAGIPLGETVPVISIDTKAIARLIKEAEAANRSAGVKDVIHIVEDPDSSGTIPKTLIQQINWTLKEGSPTPPAEWEQYDLALNGSYGIKQMIVQGRQEDGKFNYEKMRTFLNQTKDWQRGLQEDLNLIKAAYFRRDLSRLSAFKTFSESPNTSPGVPTSDFIEARIIAADIPPVRTDNTAPVGTSKAPDWSTDDTKLLAKWNSYEFTNDQKLVVTNPTPAGVRNWKVGNVVVNIAIYWDKELSEKCRVIPDLPATSPGKLSTELRDQLLAYFGALPDSNIFADSVTADDWKQYLDANDGRKAEILYMGTLVRELERKTGTLLVAPKGSPSPNAAPGAGGTTGARDSGGNSTVGTTSGATIGRGERLEREGRSPRMQ